MFYSILLIIFIFDLLCRSISLVHVLQGNFTSWFVKKWTPLNAGYNLTNIPNSKIVIIKIILSVAILLNIAAVSLLIITLPSSALGYAVFIVLIHLTSGRLIKNTLKSEGRE